MDDSLKYLLGGLGVVGLAILAIPSAESERKLPVEPVAAIAPQPEAIMPNEDPSYEDQSDDMLPDEPEMGEDEYETFGQPMNDARPLGAGGSNAENAMVATQGDGAPAQAMPAPGTITNAPVEIVQGAPAN